ncbi:hypothetical protein D3C85_1922060 [compost metagenome]
MVVVKQMYPATEAVMVRQQLNQLVELLVILILGIQILYKQQKLQQILQQVLTL